MAAAFTDERAQECARHIYDLLFTAGPLSRTQITEILRAGTNFNAGQIQWTLAQMQTYGLVDVKGGKAELDETLYRHRDELIDRVSGAVEEPEPFESVLVQQQILEVQQRMADALEAIQARLERMHD